MQQEETLESAVDSVNRPSMNAAGEETSVTIEYEKRKYPNCPIGMFPAICVKAEIKDANPNGQFYKEGDKRIHLRWQVLEPKYKDDTGTERNYMVFSRPLPVSFGPRSHMYKLWLKLTGTDVNEFLTRVPAKIPMSNGKFKDVLRLTFEHKLLENMSANIVIEHQEYNGEMRPNLANYIVNDEQRTKNYRQLPGMANAKVPEAFKEEPSVPAPTTPQQTAPVQQPVGTYQKPATDVHGRTINPATGEPLPF